MAIHLEPVGEDGNLVVVKDEVPLLEVGDVGHDVDLALPEPVEPLLPRTRNVQEFPPLAAGDLLHDVREDPQNLSILAGEDLRRILVDPHPHLPRRQEGRKREEKGGEEGDDKNTYDAPPHPTPSRQGRGSVHVPLHRLQKL